MACCLSVTFLGRTWYQDVKKGSWQMWFNREILGPAIHGGVTLTRTTYLNITPSWQYYIFISKTKESFYTVTMVDKLFKEHDTVFTVLDVTVICFLEKSLAASSSAVFTDDNMNSRKSRLNKIYVWSNMNRQYNTIYKWLLYYMPYNKEIRSFTIVFMHSYE